MISQEEKMSALKDAMKPMVEFVSKYCNPHGMVVIRQGGAELYSGELGIPFEVPN